LSVVYKITVFEVVINLRLARLE